MKVIKPGKCMINTMRVTCKKCEAVLEIEAKDLHYNFEDQDEIPSYYFKCPECDDTQYIKQNWLNEGLTFDLTHNH